MLLAELVAAVDEVAATRSRNAKVETLARVLLALDPSEIDAGVGFLSGRVRQGRIGIGRALLSATAATPARAPSLSVADLDAALDALVSATGRGSAVARARILDDLFARLTEPEAAFVRRLLIGDLRHGALEAVAAEAIARAASVPSDVVRRALMLGGDVRSAARIALGWGEVGLRAVGLTVLRPVQPMLASTADDVTSALAETGEASVEWKLDGVRIQVHRSGGDARVFTRNLNDITDRVPEIVEVALSLDADPLVLDGEAIALDETERPQVFQDTMSRVGRRSATPDVPLVPFFFDVLHAAGEDLIDRPLRDRATVLADVAERWRIPAIVTADTREAQEFLDRALAEGHEGVMVKDVASPYQAGRRGKAWRKVKVAKTFDLVVLAAEWGSGRRTGWLSNVHLGARDPSGGFVMVGKTFKGMTDEMLRWQTDRFLQLETHRRGHVVYLRPEVVVEIELDGVQGSPRYPGGVALRFARVVRYRDDKTPEDADTIDHVRALHARG